MGYVQPQYGTDFNNVFPSVIPVMTKTSNGEVWEITVNEPSFPLPFKPTQLLHREDGPARIEIGENAFRKEQWWFRGALHRVDGPAVIEEDKLMWCVHGVPHRVGGPAVVAGHSEAWWVNGYLHRVDGPARYKRVLDTDLGFVGGPDWDSEDGFNEWWLFGKRITQAVSEGFFSHLIEYMSLKDIYALPLEILEELFTSFYNGFVSPNGEDSFVL